MDASTSMTFTPGHVLLTNQRVTDPHQIDWGRAKRTLKNMLIKAEHKDMEFKIKGLSEKPCKYLYFLMKMRDEDCKNEVKTVELTVYDYFTKHRPWRNKCLSEEGIATQCLTPAKINDLYLTNVLLKINTKLGGKNSLLAVEQVPRIPLISETPTIILGMDVSHGAPGRSDVPSITAAAAWELELNQECNATRWSPEEFKCKL
ncbi:hypothetical protein MKW92_049788 [Papaver armeniacum]|nr:hypothetical protein MKW92_049788 [Papaver armeniacum]